MSEEANESPLMARLRAVGDDLTMTGTKQQGLSRSEIKSRVSVFMLSNERMSGIIAFGEGADKDDTPEGVEHFDPIRELQKDPSNLDEILMLVDHDLNLREQELLDEAQHYPTSYNVLLFGAAAKLARDEQLSDALRELVITHLINPPARVPSSKGRPKRSAQVDERKYHAIKFAIQHGLNPSRNDEGNNFSACDVVSEAAQDLYNMGHLKFSIGYSYENLKKIYFKRSC